MSRNRLIVEWCLLLAGACAFALWSLYAGATSRVDSRLLDWAMYSTGADASPDIVIAEIDDQSLAELGSWPWDRRVHAEVIDQLDAAGAKQTIYDVLFVEPTTAESDIRLAQSIANAGNVVLPHSFGADANGEVTPLYPIADIAEHAQAIGHVGAEPDADGLLRRFALELMDDGSRYPQMTLAAVEMADPENAAAVVETAKDGDGWAAIPFRSGEDFTRVSVANIVNGATPAAVLAGKTVLVGASAQGMGDRYSVPAGSVSLMTGVETQANLLNAIQDKSFVRQAGFPLMAGLICFVIFLQFAAFWLLSARASLVASLLLLVIVSVTSLAMVPFAHVWFAPGSLLLALVLAYPLWNWRRLTAVSEFLETEAARLSGFGTSKQEDSGFDVIARQVARMRRLVKEVSGGLEFMRDVIDAAPDPVVVLDDHGHVEMWNGKAAALFGDWDLQERPHFRELFLSDALTLNADAGEVETADGRTYLLAKGPLSQSSRIEGGEVLALRDITDSRIQENERREMLEFLSHDIRSPQVAIIGLANKSTDDIEEADRLVRIEKQANRALKLADDFVQLARLEQAPIQREDADLVSLMQEACDRAYMTAKKKGIVVTQSFSEEPFFAVVDASLMARIFDNLLGNAIKFSPEKSAIAFKLSEAGSGQALIELSDEGPGLPPERAADPFARFGAHDSKAGPSVGLGLAFVEKAVKKHDGTIEVWSEKGLGTTFRITLPTGV